METCKILGLDPAAADRIIYAEEAHKEALFAALRQARTAVRRDGTREAVMAFMRVAERARAAGLDVESDFALVRANIARLERAARRGTHREGYGALTLADQVRALARA